MPRTAGRIRRDEQIIRLGFALRIIRRDKRECPLGSQIGSGHTAVVRGDRKAVFLIFHHPAVRNERVQRVFEIVFACIRQLAPDVLNAAWVHQNFQQSGFQFGVCFFIFHIRPSYLRLLAKIIHCKNKLSYFIIIIPFSHLIEKRNRGKPVTSRKFVQNVTNGMN